MNKMLQLPTATNISQTMNNYVLLLNTLAIETTEVYRSVSIVMSVFFRRCYSEQMGAFRT